MKRILAAWLSSEHELAHPQSSEQNRTGANEKANDATWPNPINIIFPSSPIKCVSLHLSTLESHQPRENKMKARKLFIFPLLFTGRIFYFLVFYSTCNNLFPSRACFVSGNKIDF
jgi:hypothetical protein